VGVIYFVLFAFGVIRLRRYLLRVIKASPVIWTSSVIRLWR